MPKRNPSDPALDFPGDHVRKIKFLLMTLYLGDPLFLSSYRSVFDTHHEFLVLLARWSLDLGHTEPIRRCWLYVRELADKPQGQPVLMERPFEDRPGIDQRDARAYVLDLTTFAEKQGLKNEQSHEPWCRELLHRADGPPERPR